MEPSPAAVRPPGVPASSGMEPRPEHSFPVLTCTPGTPDWVVVLIAFSATPNLDLDNMETHLCQVFPRRCSPVRVTNALTSYGVKALHH